MKASREEHRHLKGFTVIGVAHNQEILSGRSQDRGCELGSHQLETQEHLDEVTWVKMAFELQAAHP